MSEATGGAGRILLAALETLEDGGVEYCVSHGYEAYPHRIGSDVDLIVDRRRSVVELAGLLDRQQARVGADVVRWKGSHVVLAGSGADGSPCFVTLDLSTDCALDDAVYLDGGELLARRRRHRGFWVPAADLEFGCTLARSVAKGRLGEERAGRLSSLYRDDAAGCERQAARLWGRRSAGLILAAAQSGEWAPVRQRLGALRAELRRRAVLRRPGRLAANKLHGLRERVRRAWRPDGVYLVVLGPDGAGKSSVIEALESTLAGAFPRSACYGFAPALIHRLRHGPYRENAAPHALPPRSLPVSAARALLYWLPYYTLGYLVRHRDLARSTLVLNDRHFVDVLVDPKRYRYGGPMWLVRLIWRVIPKPDLVVLLDAQPAVLRARKQELPADEVARQREAYLALVRALPNGHVVDAAQPLADVAAEVADIVLRHLRTRLARRLGAAAPRPGGPQSDAAEARLEQDRAVGGPRRAV